MDYLRSFVRWSKGPLGMGMLGGSAAVLLVTAWLLFAGRTGPRTTGEYRFMHCPKCDLEILYNFELTRAACLRCGKGTYVATRTSRAESGSGPASAGSKVLILGFVGLVLLQAVVYLWSLEHRKGPPPEDQERYKCRCPTCKRKYAYPASK